MSVGIATLRPETPIANLSAEQALLGLLLYEVETLEQLTVPVEPGHFYEPFHGRLYGIVASRAKRGQSSPWALLLDHFREDAAFQEMGGGRYLADLVDRAPPIGQADLYAAAIVDTALRRDLIDTGRELAACASAPGANGLETLHAAEKSLAELARGCGEATAWTNAGAVVSGAIQAAKASHGLPGLATGLRELDAITGGLRKGVVSILAGRPSMGKSSAGLQLAKACAQSGRGALFFSMEMPAFDLGLRLACDLANDPYAPSYGGRKDNPNYFDAAKGNLPIEHWRRLEEAEETVRNWPLAFDSRPGLTVPQMLAAARRRIREWERAGIETGCIIVDHLTIARPDQDRQGNKVAEVGDISRSLAEMAKGLDLPVVALCQLSRDVEKRQGDKRPTLADIRWCLPASALVYNPETGCRTPVGDIASGNLGCVAALDMGMSLEVADVGEIRSVGVQPILRIVTRSNRVLRCSVGHRLLAGKGYTEAKDLRVGDTVGLPRGYPETPIPATMTTDRATILGWMIGDGYLGGSPMLSVGTQADVEIAKALVSAEFPAMQFRERDNGHGRGTCVGLTFSAGTGAGAGKNPMTRWLRDIGAWGHRGADKHAPAIIFEQPAEVVAAFLRGLFHADGSMKRGAQTISFSSISERLCRDVQHLLLRVGVCSAVKCDERAKGGFASRPRAQWGVEVYGREHVARFMGRVGFLGLKHETALTALTVKINDAGHCDRLPFEATTIALSVKKARGLSWATLGWRAQGKLMSRETAAKMAEMHANEDLRVLSSSDILWDTITSIESDGSEETFDLSVPTHGNFCVDDFITHNSGEVEQDARLVIFLYRPEYYVRKPEDPTDYEAEAEWREKLKKVARKLFWLIEKNNNGPTGEVETYCDIACSAIRDRLGG